MRTRYVLDYPKADIAGMKLEIRAVDWYEIFGTLLTEDSWSAFKHEIHENEARYAPVKAEHSDVDVSQGTEGCEAQA